MVNFIKNADLYLEDYKFIENIEIPDELVEQIGEERENIDMLKLISVYKGKDVRSWFFDSRGTKKIAALASYIIEGLENNKILIIDEFDSSLHFKLTRAIISMFNNELNKNAQLIFTTHDISLMDVKKIFRKEQIWFTYKDETQGYLYSLKDFTAKNGIRDTTNLIEKYNKGILGAVPDPSLIESLIEVTS